jgi:hypothetical protein
VSIDRHALFTRAYGVHGWLLPVHIPVDLRPVDSHVAPEPGNCLRENSYQGRTPSQSSITPQPQGVRVYVCSSAFMHESQWWLLGKAYR